MNKLLVFVVLGGLVLAGAWAGGPSDVIGKLEAFDGTLTVVRGGAPVKSSLVDTGFAFENNDQVKVSPDGWADIDLDTGTGIRANLHLKASTIILLDLSSLSSKGQAAALDLMVGSIALKVQKLTGANQLDVHTQTAAMGVRGTEFAVDTEVDGSTLLTTTEGKVQLTPEEGPVHFSIPGTAVRGDGDEHPHWVETPVADPKTFVEAWHQERQRVFLAHRDAILAGLADRYRRVSERFDRSYQRLEENQKLWDAWSKEEAEGKRGPALKDERLRARIVADLSEVRRAAWNLERVHGRLSLIETRLGPAFESLHVKTSSGDWGSFVRSWHAQRPLVEQRLATVHYRVKLYALRHGGRLDRPERPLWWDRAKERPKEAR